MDVFLEYPKCLYRGAETCVVADAEAEAAQRAAGWGDPEMVTRPALDPAPVVDAPPKRGRKTAE